MVNMLFYCYAVHAISDANVILIRLCVIRQNIKNNDYRCANLTKTNASLLITCLH